MRIAVLDLGTNTFHLLIAEVQKDGSHISLFKTRAVVKLGHGSIGKNRIDADPFRKGLGVMLRFKAILEKYNVKKVFAFATSAIRSSSNGKAFVKKVKTETGIDIKVISGSREAKLIYYGVRQCIPIGNNPVLIMDIGGGSTEFIIADGKKMVWKKSFNIGVARLLNRFQPSDPIRTHEIRLIERYLDKVLQPLKKAMNAFPVTTLIGASGSFETFVEMMDSRLHGTKAGRLKNSSRLNMNEYMRLHQWLMKSTMENRMNAKGLIRMRVDSIVIASICTNYVLKKFNIREMVLSRYALKEGALWEIIRNL